VTSRGVAWGVTDFPGELRRWPEVPATTKQCASLPQRSAIQPRKTVSGAPDLDVDRISRSGADEDRASRQIRGAQLRLAFAKEQMAIDDHLRSLFQSEELPGLPPTGSWLKPKHYQRRQRLQCRKLRSHCRLNSTGLDLLMGVQPGTYASS
jgi:hypothetical protein